MLERLKTLLRISESDKDELLMELISQAREAILAYTRRNTLPTGLEHAAVRLAAAYWDRLGMEGESGRSEGGVSVTVEALPDDIRRAIAPYRIAKVGC